MWGNGKHGYSYQYTFAWRASAGGIDPGGLFALPRCLEQARARARARYRQVIPEMNAQAREG